MGCPRLFFPVWGGQTVNYVYVQPPFHHTLWQQIVSNNVDSTGQTNFKALRIFPKKLNLYLDQVARISPENHPEFFNSPSAELAYWINAYNAIALRLVLDAYPVDSLAEIPDFTSNNRYIVGGSEYSLTALRTRLLERFPNNPEVLLALTDFTKTGPLLLNQAYDADNIQSQLRFQTKAYFRDNRHFSVRPFCGAILLSPDLVRILGGTLSDNQESAPILLEQRVALPKWVITALPQQTQQALHEKCHRLQMVLPEDKHLREIFP